MRTNYFDNRNNAGRARLGQRSGNQPTIQQRGSRRQTDNGYCDATVHRDGAIWECAMRAGHRGNHRDNEGTVWDDDQAVY